MSDDIIMKVIMLRGAKGDTGNVMGKLRKTQGTQVVTAPGTNQLEIPISTFDQTQDVLLVFMNGLFLFQGENSDYTINQAGTHIILNNAITVPSYGGDIFRFIALRTVPQS